MIGVGAGRRVWAGRIGTLSAVFAGFVMLAGCGTWSTDYLIASNRVTLVEEAAEVYAQNLRWGRLKEAAAQVAAEHRVAFLELFEDTEQPFHFTSFEVVSVELTDERGRIDVLATFELYRPPSVSEQTVRDRQTWRYHKPSGRWLIEPDLSVFVGKSTGVSSGGR